jgi:hypothetical protein
MPWDLETLPAEVRDEFTEAQRRPGTRMPDSEKIVLSTGARHTLGDVLCLPAKPRRRVIEVRRAGGD